MTRQTYLYDDDCNVYVVTKINVNSLNPERYARLTCRGKVYWVSARDFYCFYTTERLGEQYARTLRRRQAASIRRAR